MAIYVLRSDNLVKIGFTDDVRRRVQGIIASTPVPVEFVGHMPGDRAVERHLHSVFASHLFSGEWFVETSHMRTIFDALLIPGLPEITTARSPKKVADRSALEELSLNVRQATEHRWPSLGKAERIDRLATELGWNRGRAKDLYYCHAKMALRAYEGSEVSAWLIEDREQA